MEVVVAAFLSCCSIMSCAQQHKRPQQLQQLST